MAQQTKPRTQPKPAPAPAADPFGQLQGDFDAFQKLEQDFEANEQALKTASQPSPLGGPGPMGQNAPGGGPTTASLGAANYALPDVPGFLKDNAPLIMGTIGSGAAAAATGGMSLPIQAGMGLLGATSGGMFGHTLKKELNANQGLPSPPGSEGGMLYDTFVEGTLPEVGGQLLGLGARTTGNIASRVRPGARNTALVDSFADPRGQATNPNRVGKPLQRHIAEGGAAAKAPLNAQYDEVLGGPLGQSRRLKIEEDPTVNVDEDVIITDHPDGSFDATEGGFTAGEMPEGVPTPFTATESGPTFAARHQRRSNALEDMRAYKKSGEKPKQARRERIRAEAEMKEMEQIAADNGLKLDEYTQLNDAYRKVSEKFDNNFQRSLQGKKGTNVIDYLTNPASWKSQRRNASRNPGGVEVMQDVPELAKNLREAIGNDDVWSVVQSAVQKRIVKQSQDMHGEVQPKLLAQKIQRMLDHGAEDLVPQHAKLLEFARTLEKYTRGPMRVPRGPNASLGMTDRLISTMGWDNALVTPDVGRKMTQAQVGQKFRSQRVAERTGQGAGAAVQLKGDQLPGKKGPQNRRDIELIPDPPRR